MPTTDPLRDAAQALLTCCRECRDEAPLFTADIPPADFIIWGKLAAPEGLGPKCYDHAVKYLGRSMPSRSDQYAVVDLRPIRAALAAADTAPITAEEARELSSRVALGYLRDALEQIAAAAGVSTEAPYGGPKVNGILLDDILRELTAADGTTPTQPDVLWEGRTVPASIHCGDDSIVQPPCLAVPPGTRVRVVATPATEAP